MKDLPTKLINLTEPNLRYYRDLHRLIHIPAGRRSRKDLIGVRKMLVDPGRGAFYMKDQMYFFCAPTHDQAKAIFWETLKKDTKLFWAKRPSETDRRIILKNGCHLKVIGLDRPERAEGQTYPPVKGVLITEMGNQRPEMWANHIQPILMDNDGFAILNGVPEGKNHWFEMCQLACGGVIPETKAGVGAYVENGDMSYHSWFSADVLSPKMIALAKSTTDPKTFRQEYEASFEGYDGLAYYAFSEDNFAFCTYQKGMSLDVGMDFNIDPMCAVEGHIINGAFYQHGESVLRNSNTREMGEHLIQKYDLRRDASGYLPATIYPDATGKHESTNASHSDLHILSSMGFRIKAHNSNPFQVDRINCVNSCCKPISGPIRYFVDQKACPATVYDLGRVEREADGRLNKRQEEAGKSTVHITDALGYLLHYNFPPYQHQIWSNR